jgi:hypothetical protein
MNCELRLPHRQMAVHSTGNLAGSSMAERSIIVKIYLVDIHSPDHPIIQLYLS